jgi:AMP-polyphosphate phosphotransferase
MTILEQIDLDHTLAKSEYRRRLPHLQTRLFNVSQALFERGTPTILVFEGWAGASKISTLQQITRRLDPRGLRLHAISPPRTYETQYPWLYRFWLKVPAYGQMAIFYRSWYRQLLNGRVRDQLDTVAWREQCRDIVTFERQMVDDGTVVLKFWLHISRAEQKHRFKKLRKKRITAWQVTDEDRWQNRHYERYATALEDLIMRTDTPFAPWFVLPATDGRYATIATFETILRACEARLGTIDPGYHNDDDTDDTDDIFDEGGAAYRRRKNELGGAYTVSHNRQTATLVTAAASGGVSATAPILDQIDLSLSLDDKRYSKELKVLQAKLHLLGLEVYRQQRPVVLVFEGWDAAGKGGSIKRVTEKLDPRAYVVHSIAAPSGADSERHYLYRFWHRLPPRGTIAIFDRSWYGRVLVERVEGFARNDAWRRAYAEINEFEAQLTGFGTIVGKFWMHISPDEQLRRFEDRRDTPHKAWKLSEEDWRNREKWPLYEQAANEMLLRTSTPVCPWTIVEAEDKRFARIKVCRVLVRMLEDQLGEVKL